mmetsp:Transcript_2849/g.6058  ORF Transcript_2849/g.6058 Transcript_2849/m.6058 type:complete len:226 (-) Transcript_2849:105-782(-)
MIHNRSTKATTTRSTTVLFTATAKHGTHPFIHARNHVHNHRYSNKSKDDIPAMVRAKVSRDEAIRSRLLRSLGIQKTQQSPTVNTTHENRNQEATTVALPVQRPTNMSFSLLRNTALIRRSLNDIEEHGDQRPSTTGRKRHVRFNSIVTEKQIASHKKYSDRIKRTLWSDAEEIQENAFRNQLEFQSEGMNWESVLENDEMYLDTNTGELIHPFWVESEDALNFS